MLSPAPSVAVPLEAETTVCCLSMAPPKPPEPMAAGEKERSTWLRTWRGTNSHFHNHSAGRKLGGGDDDFDY